MSMPPADPATDPAVEDAGAERRSLALVLGTALALRLLYVLLAPHMTPLPGDAVGYQMGAESLISGHGYARADGTPMAEYMPGYSIFLAAIYALFGVRHTAVYVVQSFIGTLSVYLIYRLARRFAGRRAGLIAAWLAALYPAGIFYCGILLTETLAVLLVSTLLWLSVRIAEDEGRRAWLWVLPLGAVVGYLFQIKAEYFALPSVFVAYAVLRRGLRRRAPHFIVAAAIAYASLTPWILRNFEIYHQFVPLRNNGGALVWRTSHVPPYLENPPENDPEWRAVMARAEVPGDPVATDKNLRKEGMKQLRANPGSYVKWCVYRGLFLFFMSHTDTVVGVGRSYRDLLNSRAFVLLLLKMALFALQIAYAIVGLASLWRTRGERRLWPFRVAFVLNVIIYMLLYGTVRYSMVLMPALFVATGVAFAGAWGDRLIALVHRRRAPSPSRA